jgi:hypothetical protein
MSLTLVTQDKEPESVMARWIRSQAVSLAEFAAEEALHGQFGYGAFVVILTDGDRGYAGQFRPGLDIEEQKRVSMLAVTGLRKLADEIEAKVAEL